MNNTNMRVVSLAVAAALMGQTTLVSAAGFQLMEQNASGLGNAYAGQGAAAQDASTIFYNPAGMTKLPGRNVVGAVNAIRPSAEFSNTGSLAAPLQPFGNNGGDAGDWAFVPSAYMSWQLMPQLWVGLGVNAPFGLKTEYDPAWVGRFHGIESEVKTINVNPSVAWKVNDMFSVGGGINYQHINATLTNAVNYSGAAFAAGGLPLLGAIGGAGVEGVARVEADDNAWGWNIGAMFDVNPNMRIGAAYRSSMKYTLEGTVGFTNRPALLAGALPDGPVNATIKLPAVASLNLFYKFTPQWDFLADIAWTEWSTLKSLDIFRSNTGALLATTPLNWRDTWRAGLGANYHYNDRVTARIGVAYDQTPVQEPDRSVRVPDEDRFWLAIGAQYRFNKQFAVDVGYAHLFVKDGTVNLCGPATAATTACNGKNQLIGTYSNKVDILGVQARYSF